MAKYYKRSDGLYETIRTINGKRKAFRGKTCREVDRKILEYQQEKEQGRKYKDVLKAFWEEKESAEWSANTAATYKRICDRLEERFGDLRVSEIRPIDIERYLLEMKQKGYRRGSVTSELSLLKNSLRWAVVHGDIDISPCAEVCIPKGLYQKKREALTEDQIRAVMAYRGPHWLLGLMLMYTGCRRGELLALHYEDIDRKAGLIHINKKLNYAMGNTPFMEHNTKTAAGMRNIVLLPALAEAIPMGRIGLIFHNDDGSLISKSVFERMWLEYNCGIGFPIVENEYRHKRAEITPHCFRHTFATLCYDAGIDPKSTAAMLGHADEAITLGLYTHLSRTRKLDAGEKLAAQMKKLEEKNA